MHTVSAEHAKAHFDELVDVAVHGEAVAIDVSDEFLLRWTIEKKMPDAKASDSGWPVLGMLKGRVWVSPDFDDLPDGFEDYVK